MSNKVKICGIKTIEAANAAIDAGADFLGFVFYPPSPRNITPADSAKFANLNIAKVAVVVDADDEFLQDIVENLNPDYIQLHGKESQQRLDEITTKFGLPIIRSIKPNHHSSFINHQFLLVDPSDGKGKTFDWENFTPPTTPYFLSGGLTPDNVQEAAKKTGATMFDVSSGVEKEKGVKDFGLIKEFIKNVKS